MRQKKAGFREGKDVYNVFIFFFMEDSSDLCLLKVCWLLSTFFELSLNSTEEVALHLGFTVCGVSSLQHSWPSKRS